MTVFVIELTLRYVRSVCAAVLNNYERNCTINHYNLFLFPLQNQQNIRKSSLYPEALTVYGNWLAETCAESPNVITENYLDKVGL